MVNEETLYALEEDVTPHETAEAFLSYEGYKHEDGYDYLYYRGNFYKYQGTHYKPVLKDSVLLEIFKFLQNQPELGKKTRTHFAKEVLMNVAAIVMVPDDIVTPCFLNKPLKYNSRLISMKNGIFDLNLFIKGKNPLLPHTRQFFSLNCLPYDYRPKAKCPKWLSFLDVSQPDKAIQQFLKEWMGYNLTAETMFHKFVLLVGAGANGKSVFCTVMRELIGRENISAVGLEQFSPTRLFPLAAMEGKIANIVEEIGDVDKVAEDILKTIVAGGEMTVERKGRDPFLLKFFAKLTFATNIVPRFRDRSDGTWRRVIFIPFNVQILDPKKQNKNLVDGAWWIKQGEMEGILNWALEGLAHLIKRDSFVEPQASLEMKNEFKEEANPAVTFLLDNYEIKEGGNLSAHRLYESYADTIKAFGGAPLGKGLFTREVKKIFPLARQSKHPRKTSLDGGKRIRSRVWENIQEKK